MPSTGSQPSCLGAIKKQGKPAAGEEEKPALQEAASHRGKNMETRVSSKLFLSFPALLHLAAIFASVRRSSAASFFVIGDSSVNCGNNGFFSPILSDNDNASLFLCDATDQLLLVPDLLAEKMGLPPAPPFYGQNKTLEGLLGGLNFGSSPATVLNWGAPTFQNLNAQLRQASETFQLLQMEVGLQKARAVAESSLFYISIGKDDYIQYLRDPDGVGRRHTPQVFARMLVNQVTRTIKDMYNANVRRIICTGIEPLGCAPRSLWQAYNSTSARAQSSCVDDINRMIADYNAMLSLDLLALNLQMPDAKIVFCDVYRGMMEMITDPKRHGFEDVDSACCGAGRFGGMLGCVSRRMACRGRAGSHVWWDLYNPTGAANSLLAEWMWSGSPHRICTPTTVQETALATR